MYLTAIDLGSSQIKGVVSEVKKNGSVVIVKTFRKPARGMKRGEIVEPEETVKSLFEALSEVKRFDRRCIKNLVFGISATHSAFHVSRGTISIPRPDHEILAEDIDRVVRESLAVNIPSGWQIIHSFPREFIIDDIEVDDANVVGLSGRKLSANVVLISIFSSVYRNFLKVAHLVLGKKSEFDGSLIFSPIACEHAVLSKDQKDLGVVLVDIGFGVTSVSAYQDGKMITIKVFPVGSGSITNDLAVGLKCSVQTAEKIKVKFGSAFARGVSIKEKVDLSEFEEGQGSEVSKKFIAEIIEARAREIFSFVHKELEAFGKVGKLPAGVVVTGGGSKIPGILDIAREELKLPAHIGFPNLERLESSHASVSEELDDPEMSVACGLVLQKIDTLKKGSGFGLMGKSSYNLNESWIKKFIKTLMVSD